MKETLGARIGRLRREKGLKQDDVAQALEVSSQAVSKWENDQTCPDITLLPALANMLGVTVDELLCGKQEPLVQVQPIEKRKDAKDMFLRMIVQSASGDKVRINLPLVLVQAIVEAGVGMHQIAGGDNNAFKNIDLKQILTLAQQGVIGNLMEAESKDGDIVRVFVE